MEKKRAQWGSKMGFILAAAGSAVGLGNIWKFPGKAYEGGGGVFLIVYLLVVLLVGIPVMMTELSLGRHTQSDAVNTFRKLDKRFTWIGAFGIICSFIIMGYYSHVGGWVMSYIGSYLTEPGAVMGGKLTYFYAFLGIDAATGATWFPWRAIIFAAIFIVLNAIVLLKGVSEGLEKFNRIGMPALFIMLIILLIRSVTLPGAQEGLTYLLSVDLSKLTGNTLITALGQAFYSLSLGMAIMLTYGSYLKKEERIQKNTFIICGLDTLVAFLGGFIIVPSVFATLGPGAIGKGGGFAFGPLGGVFEAMPAGQIFGIIFYLLLFFAAISSSTSIAEALIAYLTDQFGLSRKKATIGLLTVCFAMGIVYTISQAAYNIRLPWLDFSGVKLIGAGDWMEFLCDRLLMPICALGECIFVGWVWKPENVIREATAEGAGFSWPRLYSFLIKYVCPIAILAIIILSLVMGVSFS